MRTSEELELDSTIAGLRFELRAGVLRVLWLVALLDVWLLLLVRRKLSNDASNAAICSSARGYTAMQPSGHADLAAECRSNAVLAVPSGKAGRPEMCSNRGVWQHAMPGSTRELTSAGVGSRATSCCCSASACCTTEAADACCCSCPARHPACSVNGGQA